MTIKEYIKKYFEDHVQWNDKYNMWDDRDFWQAWDELDIDAEKGGVQWCYEWYQDEPPLTQAREKFILSAIDNYIKRNIKPIYVNY